MSNTLGCTCYGKTEWCEACVAAGRDRQVPVCIGGSLAVPFAQAGSGQQAQGMANGQLAQMYNQGHHMLDTTRHATYPHVPTKDAYEQLLLQNEKLRAHNSDVTRQLAASQVLVAKLEGCVDELTGAILRASVAGFVDPDEQPEPKPATHAKPISRHALSQGQPGGLL